MFALDSLFCPTRLSDIYFFFSSRRRHTRLQGDWSSDVCSSDLVELLGKLSAARVSDVLAGHRRELRGQRRRADDRHVRCAADDPARQCDAGGRSEERRVGKECRSPWAPDHLKKKKTGEYVGGAR